MLSGLTNPSLDVAAANPSEGGETYPHPLERIMNLFLEFLIIIMGCVLAGGLIFCLSELGKYLVSKIR